MRYCIFMKLQVYMWTSQAEQEGLDYRAVSQSLWSRYGPTRKRANRWLGVLRMKLPHPPPTNPENKPLVRYCKPLDLFKLFIQTNAEFTTIYCWFLISWINHSDWFSPLDFQDFLIDYSMLLLVWIRIQSNFTHLIENAKTFYKYLVPNCRWDELYFWGQASDHVGLKLSRGLGLYSSRCPHRHLSQFSGEPPADQQQPSDNTEDEDWWILLPSEKVHFISLLGGKLYLNCILGRGDED